MKSVLVVEDNKKAAVLVEKILKEIDGSIRVSVATDCEKAKQMLLQEDFHLFVVIVVDCFHLEWWFEFAFCCSSF